MGGDDRAEWRMYQTPLLLYLFRLGAREERKLNIQVWCGGRGSA
jgi:hypothetical protein